MDSQILIRVDKELKEWFQRLSRIERKSTNQLVRELIEGYVEAHNPENAMKGLWDEIGQPLKSKGYKSSDVKKMIRKVRTRQISNPNS